MARSNSVFHKHPLHAIKHIFPGSVPSIMIRDSSILQALHCSLVACPPGDRPGMGSRPGTDKIQMLLYLVKPRPGEVFAWGSIAA